VGHVKRTLYSEEGVANIYKIDENFSFNFRSTKKLKCIYLHNGFKFHIPHPSNTVE
jgi:hypothetical protein